MKESIIQKRNCKLCGKEFNVVLGNKVVSKPCPTCDDVVKIVTVHNDMLYCTIECMMKDLKQ